MTQTVLILGASGKIGRHAATAFREAGWNVRCFNRQKDDMNAAAVGADIIVNGMNPVAYHNWAETIPAITSQVITAAKTAGASVIIPGNVYNFGNTPGVWSEHTPQNATTRKGRVRIEMEQAFRDSGVQTIVLRAGNFIETAGTDDIMALLLMRSIKKRRITYAGGPDVMQAYCYLPDWAKAAVMLGEKRDQLARFEDIPFPGHSFTVNELRATLEAVLSHTLTLSALPWWLMTLAAPFWELAREMTEMRYLWNTAHEISGEKFARILPDFVATDLRSVMTAGLPAKIHPDQGMPGRPGVSLA